MIRYCTVLLLICKSHKFSYFLNYNLTWDCTNHWLKCHTLLVAVTTGSVHEKYGVIPSNPFINSSIMRCGCEFHPPPHPLCHSFIYVLGGWDDIVSATNALYGENMWMDCHEVFVVNCMLHVYSCRSIIIIIIIITTTAIAINTTTTTTTWLGTGYKLKPWRCTKHSITSYIVLGSKCILSSSTHHATMG